MMQKVFSSCDWCKKVSFVEKLTYLDGYTNYTCEQCKKTAVIDIKRYNDEELIRPQKASLMSNAL
jgi:hypothetical protein